MNTKSLIAAAALALGATGAFAGPSAAPMPESTLSRDEVKAELRQLQAHGAWQEVNEASPDALEADQNAKIAAHVLGQDQASQVALYEERDGTVLVVPADSAVIIEVVPQEDPTEMESMPGEMPRDAQPDAMPR